MENNNNIFFTKKNYLIIIAGILVFVIGYFLMAGGNPEDPSDYSDEIFNFRRLTLAPFVAIAGYVIVLLGIIKNFRTEEEDTSDSIDLKK